MRTSLIHSFIYSVSVDHLLCLTQCICQDKGKLAIAKKFFKCGGLRKKEAFAVSSHSPARPGWQESLATSCHSASLLLLGPIHSVPVICVVCISI